jgi:hypothetical protein
LSDHGHQSRAAELAKVGLHFCRYYRNLVRYDPEFCGKCPHNGLKRLTEGATSSDTCF